MYKITRSLPANTKFCSYSLQINKPPLEFFFFVDHHNYFRLHFLYIILLKRDTTPGITYNVHCSPSSIVDVGISASVEGDAVVESPKIHNNVLITELNSIANNLANYYTVLVIFSVLGEFLCFNAIFLCICKRNAILLFFKF